MTAWEGDTCIGDTTQTEIAGAPIAKCQGSLAFVFVGCSVNSSDNLNSVSAELREEVKPYASSLSA